ncbi:MAG TPA: YdeI/OmpD-associated family protein [Caulobacteraceae bacterium]
MQFETILKQGVSKNLVGIVIPPEVVGALGGGKRAPVKITLNGYSYRSTIAVMGGDCMVGVAAEHREKAGVAGGERVMIDIELDTAARTVEVPPDLAGALSEAGAMAAFEALAFSHRKEHVRAINDAKAPETRQRRIAAAVQKVLAGKR